MYLQELRGKGFRTIIPELRVGDKVAYGIAIEEGRAYVVYPNGLEEEIKNLLKVEEVVRVEDRL